MNAFLSAAVAGLAVAALMTKLGDDKQTKKEEPMDLGTFCICLSVKDVKASKAFYEKLDFKQVAGKVEQNWVVMQSGTTKIGLLQGMLEKNTLTFNPGTTPGRETLKEFQDVRDLQHAIKARGITFKTEADEKTDGPAHFELVDPDGNPILVDQNVPKPKK